MPENENIFVLDYKLTLIHHAPKIKYVINQNMILLEHFIIEKGLWEIKAHLYITFNI